MHKNVFPAGGIRRYRIGVLLLERKDLSFSLKMGPLCIGNSHLVVKLVRNSYETIFQLKSEISQLSFRFKFDLSCLKNRLMKIAFHTHKFAHGAKTYIWSPELSNRHKCRKFSKCRKNRPPGNIVSKFNQWALFSSNKLYGSAVMSCASAVLGFVCELVFDRHWCTEFLRHYALCSATKQSYAFTCFYFSKTKTRMKRLLSSKNLKNKWRRECLFGFSLFYAYMKMLYSYKYFLDVNQSLLWKFLQNNYLMKVLWTLSMFMRNFKPNFLEI